jgi:hypothetical protein
MSGSWAAFWLVFDALIGGAVTLTVWLLTERSLGTAMLLAIPSWPSPARTPLPCPIAAGVFEPAFGLVLRPETAALSGSGFTVAVNARSFKGRQPPGTSPVPVSSSRETAAIVDEPARRAA